VLKVLEELDCKRKRRFEEVLSILKKKLFGGLRK